MRLYCLLVAVNEIQRFYFLRGSSLKVLFRFLSYVLTSLHIAGKVGGND